MMFAMNYEEAIKHVMSALKFGIDPSLEPIAALCQVMGQPQDAYKCVQIAGTNGKSSTSRMIAALLHAGGKRVGLYTSPHLVEYPERIEIDGRVIDKQLFADGMEAVLRAGECCGVVPTEFELLTAAAFWIFAHEGVDVAVLECGLGGRWDATSVCKPQVAVITGIGLDHVAILGDTVEKIAAEKAAIIKSGAVAVLADELVAREVFVERAKQVGSEFIDVDCNVSVPYASALAHMPSYQLRNAATALTAVAAFEKHCGKASKCANVGEGASENENVDANGCASAHVTFEKAFSRLVIPGRFETLRQKPLLLIDAAHNPQSASVLAEELKKRQLDCTLVLGVLADKDCDGIVETLAPIFQRIVVTQSSSPRALPVAELAKLVRLQGKEPRIAQSVKEALEMTCDEDVIATGSITIAGEVKAIFSALV